MGVSTSGDANELAAAPGVNVADSPTEPLIRGKVTGDSYDRVRLLANGTLQTGDGTAAPVSSGTSVVDAALYGAVGDGITDDSAAIQSALTAVGDATYGGTLLLRGSHRVTKNLYLFGKTNVMFLPGAEIVVDSDCSAADGSSYWLNAGVKSKGGMASTWTGRMTGGTIRATANAVGIGRLINVHRCDHAFIDHMVIDVTATGLSAVGAIGCYNNAAWCSSPSKKRLHISDNKLLAAQNSVGSEAIAVGNGSFVWIEDNYAYGWGDDLIGLHAVDDFLIRGNRTYGIDGRYYLSGCRRGAVVNNWHERIANPDATWASGGGLITVEIETSTQPAPEDILIQGNDLIHGSGIVSATYGIRLQGARRCRVVNNRIHDTTGFGKGVTYQGQIVAGWVDATGVDADGQARTHDLFIADQTFTGGGASLVTDGVDPFASSNVNATVRQPVIRHMKPGLYLALHAGSLSTGAPALNSLQVQPLVVDEPITLDHIGVEVTVVGAAGAVRRLGIYSDDGNGYPGGLLLDAGTVVADVGTGLKEIVIAQTLQPGIYWLADVAQVAVSTVRTHTCVPPIAVGSATATTVTGNPLFGYQHTGAAGALPGTFTTVANPSGGNMPRIVVRRSF